MRLGAALAAVLLFGCGTDEAQDVRAPYIPSPDGVVAEMLELADVGPDDHVIDLGSGDGRIVLTAAKVFGASGLGVEIRPDLVELSNDAAREQGLADRVEFLAKDLFVTDISPASVLTMYLLPEVVNRLKGKLLAELKPGTRVLSHDYPVEGWDHQRQVEMQHDDKIAVTGVSRTLIYLYVVPANVAGRWQVSLPSSLGPGSVTLELDQNVTRVTGAAILNDRRYPLDALSLHGRQFSFQVAGLDAVFNGEVSHNRIQGSVRIGGEYGIWRAARAGN